METDTFTAGAKMLSFELKKPGPTNDPGELEIHCDMDGFDSLLAQLRLLRDSHTDHVHIMSEAWGGIHLDGRTQRPANSPLHHVVVHLRRPQS
jgi:hypothetical protein